VLVDDKSPTTLAAAAHRVISDPTLAAALVDRGRARLDELGLEASSRQLRTAVSAILADLGHG
jgi:hypothetical protein